MTPQERDLITQLLARLKQAGGQPKDLEADQLIRQALVEQPDAPYYLVQTVLIQDMALASAQSRIAELERQLAAAKPAQPTSFLGGLFGHSGASSAPPPAAAAPTPGPWSRPAPGPQAQPQYPQPQYQQPQYQAPPQPAMAGPWGGQPMMGGGGGFLRQAAATAAGVAGGALLFEGIQSMFGQHAGGILANSGMQPGISETVINNYYGSDPATQAAWNDDPAGATPADYAADAPADPGADFASNDDMASDQDLASDSDFSGNDDLA